MKKKNLEEFASDTQKKRGWKKLLGLALPLLTLLAGIYLLSLVFAPKLAPYLNSGKVQKVVDSGAPKEGDDRLYIPKLGVNVELNTGGEGAMHAGNAWHRFPERGDPVQGGNFIISAHRWIRGSTPQQTIAQSPFYNMDRMEVGDSIFVDFGGKRYKYEIYETQQVEPDQTQIEEPIAEGEEPHMTLYTCTLKGSADGRVVIYAKLAKL